MHFQKVASEVFKRTQEVKKRFGRTRLPPSQAGVRWEKHLRAGNPCCNPPRAAAGERLPKITLRGFQVEKKEKEKPPEEEPLTQGWAA